MHFHVEALEVVGHDSQYAMYTTEIEEEWIRLHVENKGGLTSEPEEKEKKWLFKVWVWNTRVANHLIALL